MRPSPPGLARSRSGRAPSVSCGARWTTAFKRQTGVSQVSIGAVEPRPEQAWRAPRLGRAHLGESRCHVGAVLRTARRMRGAPPSGSDLSRNKGALRGRNAVEDVDELVDDLLDGEVDLAV